MYDRIIDLGCGDASYAPRLLPPTRSYVGVDLITQDWAADPPDARMTFLQGDALSCLGELNPGAKDLVFSLFAAHHVGQQELRLAILDCGADVLLIEPVRAHPTSASRYVAISLILSKAALLCAGKKRGHLRPFVDRQSQFLRNPANRLHIESDLQHDRLHDFSYHLGLSKLRFGSLNVFHRGAGVQHWIDS